jgi:hypothetical protein
MHSPVASPAIEANLAQVALEHGLRLKVLGPQTLGGQIDHCLVPTVKFQGLLVQAIGLRSPDSHDAKDCLEVNRHLLGDSSRLSHGRIVSGPQDAVNPLASCGE